MKALFDDISRQEFVKNDILTDVTIEAMGVIDSVDYVFITKSVINCLYSNVDHLLDKDIYSDNLVRLLKNCCLKLNDMKESSFSFCSYVFGLRQLKIHQFLGVFEEDNNGKYLTILLPKEYNYNEI